MPDIVTTTALGSPAPAPCPGCAELRRRIEELERRLRARDDEAARERVLRRCHPEGDEVRR